MVSFRAFPLILFENARDICRVSTKFEAVERETLVDFFSRNS